MKMMGKFTIGCALLSVALLGACKPTPRTANDHPSKAETESAAEPPSPGQQSQENPSPAPLQPAVEQPAGLLKVFVVSRAHNPLRPWEMEGDKTNSSMGVYLGNGRVLTTSENLPTATYVEIRLPDQSRAVPARVVKVDADLGLALLTVQHEKDTSIFDASVRMRLALPCS